MKYKTPHDGKLFRYKIWKQYKWKNIHAISELHEAIVTVKHKHKSYLPFVNAQIRHSGDFKMFGNPIS
jgi:hypothetical protein